MQCPGCRAAMRTIEYEGIHIETCPSCGGEWLDSGELKKVVNVRQTRFTSEERREMAQAAKITPIIPADHDRNLTCPKCRGQTDAVNYGGDSGIVIDKCTGCGGIWLDRTEMEKVQIVVELWQDGLADDLQHYGAKMRQVAADLDRQDNVRVSRLRFVNAIINGILDRIV